MLWMPLSLGCQSRDRETYYAMECSYVSTSRNLYTCVRTDLLWNHLEVGVIWLPRPSAILVASWARDLASPPPSPLANCFRGAPCRCGEGMLPCGCTVSLQSPPSLTVLSDFFFLFCFVFCLFVVFFFFDILQHSIPTRVYCCFFCLSFLSFRCIYSLI